MLYNYNDMVRIIVGGPNNFYDQLSAVIFNNLIAMFGSILANNIYVILNLLVCLFITYKLVKSLKLSTAVSIITALTYSLSPYFIFRVISYTPSLYCIWLFPLLIFLLNKNAKLRYILIFLLVAIFLSNYYGYFCYFIFLFWRSYDVLRKKLKWTRAFREVIAVTFGMILCCLIFILPVLETNLPIFGSYFKNTHEKTTTYRIYRPIEDIYNLSLRPWYFLIPPKTSLFFGDISQIAYSKIEGTGNYLTTSYTEEEMAGAYIGWQYIIGFIVVLVLLVMERKRVAVSTTFPSVVLNKYNIQRFFYIIILILCVSGPPTISVFGLKIYTPTYVLYYIVPIFRTLVRWELVIFLFVLLTCAYLIDDILNWNSSKFYKCVLVTGLFCLNITIFAIKLPVINICNVPLEYQYISSFKGENYIVFPKGDYYSIFWGWVSHVNLNNPVDNYNKDLALQPDQLIPSLFHADVNSLFLKEHNINLLVYYPRNISADLLSKVHAENAAINRVQDLTMYLNLHYGIPVSKNGALIYLIK